MTDKDLEELRLDGVMIFGNTKFRGACPLEAKDAEKFVREVRKNPTYGMLVTHIRNEGKSTVQAKMRMKRQGMTKGASDIIIPTAIPFVCEMKRANVKKSEISAEQKFYLKNAIANGSFACVTLGYKGAIDALVAWEIILNNYLRSQTNRTKL